jgi:hypothetical protein
VIVVPTSTSSAGRWHHDPFPLNMVSFVVPHDGGPRGEGEEAEKGEAQDAKVAVIEASPW